MKLIKKEKILSKVDLSYDEYILVFSCSVLCIIYAHHYISKFNKVTS